MRTKRLKMGIGRRSKRSGLGSGWNDLPLDIWLIIFSRLDPECLLKTAYSVCPFWRSASKLLVFRKGDGFIDFSMFKEVPLAEIPHFMKLLKNVMDVTQYKSEVVTRLQFPQSIHLPDNHLSYVAQRCPNLQYLHLPDIITMRGLSTAVQNWKDLRKLLVRSVKSSDFVEVIHTLGSNFKFLEYLTLYGVDETLESKESLIIDECTSQLLVNNLCKVNVLFLANCLVHKLGLENLMMKCTWAEAIVFGHSVNVMGCETYPASYFVKRNTLEDGSSNWSMRRFGYTYNSVQAIINRFW